jgi:DedD protein
MAGEQDTELTLSTGKLLGLFFGLVVVCGIFFSLGYAVGKNNAPGASNVVMDSSTVAANTSSGANKPAAGKLAPPDQTSNCSAGDASCSAPAQDANGAANNPPAAQPSTESAKATDSTEAKSTAAPELSNAPGFMVQVAAVSKQEDADALVAALRKKQYPVIMVPNPANKLFHVQVGPFADQKDAEAMRTKLAGDGYNAFIKK